MTKEMRLRSSLRRLSRNILSTRSTGSTTKAAVAPKLLKLLLLMKRMMKIVTTTKMIKDSLLSE